MPRGSRAKRHVERRGVSSGFSLHYRNLGVRQEIMDRWIQRFYRRKADLLQQAMAAGDFNAMMGVAAIAAGDYKPDRHHSLAGAAAYDREKRKYMKDLGLARADDVITARMRQYIRILEKDGDRVAFLRDQALKMKLICPQTATVKWTPRQNGYAHYRIRPIVMFLYAVRRGHLDGVEVNTDDLALSAFRFFTPREQGQVDEDFLRAHVDSYFERKRNVGIDCQAEFRRLMERTERDLGRKLRNVDKHAFARKCRNAGNEVYCTIIFLRQLGLIGAPKTRPTGWSCTQQRYENTGPVPEFNILSLTSEGDRALGEAISTVPVWHADVVRVFGDNCHGIIAILNRLANGQQIETTQITDQEVHELRQVGVNLIREDGTYRATQSPVFELQYDMPLK